MRGNDFFTKSGGLSVLYVHQYCTFLMFRLDTLTCRQLSYLFQAFVNVERMEKLLQVLLQKLQTVKYLFHFLQRKSSLSVL